LAQGSSDEEKDLNRKELIVDTGAPNEATERDRGSKAASPAANGVESGSQAELDVICNFLGMLDAVGEGDFQWSDGATTVSAVKQSPPRSRAGPRSDAGTER